MRERAFLIKTSATLCGATWRDVRPLALAAECMIASALTADDVLDEAHSRWGKPAVWTRWGTATAILISEVLHALGNCSLDHVPRAAAEPVRIAFQRLLEGQFRHLRGSSLRSPRVAIELAMERTGALLQACVVAPANLTKSPFRRSLAVFGENFGIAFQLADDLFDFLGDPRAMGKPILGDLLNRQPNLLLAHVLACPPSPAKREITHWLGRGVDSTPKNPARVLSALHKLGVVARATRTLRRYVDRARACLHDIPPGDQRNTFDQFVTLVSGPLLYHDRHR